MLFCSLPSLDPLKPIFPVPHVLLTPCALPFLPKEPSPNTQKSPRNLHMFKSDSTITHVWIGLEAGTHIHHVRTQNKHPTLYVAAPSSFCHTSPKLQLPNSRKSNVSIFHGFVSSLLSRLNYKNVKDPFMFRLWPLCLLLSSQIENSSFFNCQKGAARNQDIVSLWSLVFSSESRR
jgi:hypothetical protein